MHMPIIALVSIPSILWAFKSQNSVLRYKFIFGFDEWSCSFEDMSVTFNSKNDTLHKTDHILRESRSQNTFFKHKFHHRSGNKTETCSHTDPWRNHTFDISVLPFLRKRWRLICSADAENKYEPTQAKVCDNKINIKWKFSFHFSRDGTWTEGWKKNPPGLY